MISEDQVFLQQLRAQLGFKPNCHILHHVLAKLPNVADYSGYFFAGAFEAEVSSFMELENIKIDRVSLTADIGLSDENGRDLPALLKGVLVEFFLAVENENWDPDFWLQLNMDDLLFYLNRYQNDKVRSELGFPGLTSCEVGGKGFNLIMTGREFRNKYFPCYYGPVLDLYFENELNELFAIASNALASLYRIRDRAIEELELSPNFRYGSSLQLYPRFNNGIAEVAGTIYACWERIVFLFNEFFPLNSQAKMAPSFKNYVLAKVKESLKDARLQNGHLDWFKVRIDGPHLTLEELRHPTVHYNKFRTPSGTRAVELMKNTITPGIVADTIASWNAELEFLKGELAEFDTGLKQAMGLLETWAAGLGLG